VNTKRSRTNTAVCIFRHVLRGRRHVLPGIALAIVVGATPALAQVTGDDIPPIVDAGNQFALPCDTSFTGCRVDGQKALIVPSGEFQIFLEGTEFDAVGRGQGLIFFLGKRKPDAFSSEEVCVTTARNSGNPALRERTNCVEIGFDDTPNDNSGFCANGACTNATTCPDQSALLIGTDAAFCAGLLPTLRAAYNVPANLQLAYAMAYSGGTNTGQERWARVVKCSSAVRHRCTPNTDAVVGQGMREEAVLHNNPTSTGGTRYR
jgi:hypothetical protein